MVLPGPKGWVSYAGTAGGYWDGPGGCGEAERVSDQVPAAGDPTGVLWRKSRRSGGAKRGDSWADPKRAGGIRRF